MIRGGQAVTRTPFLSTARCAKHVGRGIAAKPEEGPTTTCSRWPNIKRIVEKNRISPSDVESLLRFCFETEAFEYVRNLAKKNEAEATGNLSVLRSSSARDVLQCMINEAYARVANLCI